MIILMTSYPVLRDVDWQLLDFCMDVFGLVDLKGPGCSHSFQRLLSIKSNFNASSFEFNQQRS
jgi:hypothetical protein